MIDIYTLTTKPDQDEEKHKKNRSGNQSAITSIWRSIVPLNPFTARSSSNATASGNNLPRYDVHNSPPTAAAAAAPPPPLNDHVPELLAVTTPRHQSSLDTSSSSSSLEDSLSFDDDDEDLENNRASRRRRRRAEEVWLYEEGSAAPRHAWILRRKPTFQEVDVEAYMANREMTALQEKWNALTMIPHPVLCLYFVLAGLWIPHALVQEMQQDMVTTAAVKTWPETWMGEPEECLAQTWSSWWWGVVPSYWPPAPVLAVAVGVTLHAPWSMLYHWKYAHSLPPGAARTNHWSRRMDQAMLHFACAAISYATSGSWDYMIATALFNADSAYRHFTPKVSPRRNKVRITLAIIAYSIPMLRAGHTQLFLQFWFTMSVCMWLFATYPIGGWSHAVFHVVSIFSLIPLLQAASLTAAAQEAVQMAAQCTAWNQTV